MMDGWVLNSSITHVMDSSSAQLQSSSCSQSGTYLTWVNRPPLRSSGMGTAPSSSGSEVLDDPLLCGLCG